MPRFNYRFINEKTGRLNKGSRSAYDEEELRADLKAQGVDPVEVEIQSPEPATDRQLDFLKDLGGSWTGDLTKAEASDLIDNLQRRWTPMQPSLHRLAHRYRVEVTRFTSKERLYNSICSGLSAGGHERGLAEWFTYRVYRANCDRSRFMLDQPGDPQFVPTISALMADQTAMQSLRRAARETQSGFRWFGTFIGRHGETITGDSRRTACFKLVHQSLATANLIPEVPKSDAQASQGVKQSQKEYKALPVSVQSHSNGCLGSAVLLVGGFSGFIFWLL